MTTFPGSPKLIKGAIVGIDLWNPVASVIIFQYNPDSLTRTIKSKISDKGGNPSEVLRIHGAPVETIKVELEIDATDQLEKGTAMATGTGIYPQLSALEMLVYPKSALVITNTVLMLAGSRTIIPPSAPFTLFIWGPKRVLPVMLTDFTITEEAYDTNLNPIRARASIGLRVLSYDDFPADHAGYYLFLTHQIIKETMAAMGSVGNISDLGGGNVKLF